MTGIGYVVFEQGDRMLVGRLEQVREIVRAAGIESIPGARPPVSALLHVRGRPLALVDMRSPDDGPADRGDVVVLAEYGDGPVGIAVDRVVAVLPAEALVALPVADRPRHLPDYVVDMVTRADGDPLLLVDLPALAGLPAQT